MRFKLIAITTEAFFEGEAKWISELFEAGLQALHIRKPGCSRNQLKNFIASIPPRYHRRLILHSHYSLLSHFRLGGIHLTEKTRRKSIPQQLDKKKHSLSASFHSVKDISAGKRKYDYIFLSPVFDSISKKGHTGTIDLASIHSFVSHRKNIIALGGITDRNLLLIKESGFAGAAVLGFIWEAKNPVKNFRKLASKI